MRISQIDIQLMDLPPIDSGAAAPLRHSQDVVWDNQVPSGVIRACPLWYHPTTSTTSLVLPPHLDCC